MICFNNCYPKSMGKVSILNEKRECFCFYWM
jgi:hypothetical protein